MKQDMLQRIEGIITGHGAEIAFPTTTVHVPDQVRLAQAAGPPPVP